MQHKSKITPMNTAVPTGASRVNSRTFVAKTLGQVRPSRDGSHFDFDYIDSAGNKLVVTVPFASLLNAIGLSLSALASIGETIVMMPKSSAVGVLGVGADGPTKVLVEFGPAAFAVTIDKAKELGSGLLEAANSAAKSSPKLH